MVFVFRQADRFLDAALADEAERADRVCIVLVLHSQRGVRRRERGRSAFSPEVISRSTRLLLPAMVVVKVLSDVRRVAALLRQLFASMQRWRGVWLFSREFPLDDDDTAAARPSASSPLRSPSNFGQLERRRPVSEKQATIGDPLDDILQHWMQCELKLYALPTRIQLGRRLDLSGRSRDRTERCRESLISAYRAYVQVATTASSEQIPV